MYVVFGVPGQTGSVVANTLLSKGVSVRVVARDVAKVEGFKVHGAQAVAADVYDADSIAKALEDAQVAYLMNPPAYEKPDMFAEAEIVGKNLQEAVKRSGLKRFVFLSSVGAHLPSGTGNILTTYIHEQMMSETGVPVTFVRCAWFMQNWGGVVGTAKEQGVLPSFLTPLDRRIPMVSTDDIGRVCGEAMLEDWTGKRIKELYGKDVSPNDAAAAFSEAFSRDVQAVEIPRDDWKNILLQFNSPKNADAWIEMIDAFNSGYMTFEGGSIEQVSGRVTMAEAARDMARR